MLNKIFKTLFFIILIVIVCTLIYVKQQEKALNESINNYIETKKISKNSKLKNEYKKIEETILDYLVTSDKYLNEINKIKIEINDYEYYTADAISNSLNDDFNDVKTKLSEYELTLNEKMNQYLLLNDYNTLLKKYNNDSKYFKKLYIELLGPASHYEKEVKVYDEELKLYKNYFITAIKYIDFLKNSSVIVDKEKNLIFFRNSNEITEYDKIHKELETIINKI